LLLEVLLELLEKKKGEDDQIWGARATKTVSYITVPP
jgi:hypothetical protein